VDFTRFRRPVAGAAIAAAALLIGALARQPLLAALSGVIGGILAVLVGWESRFPPGRRAEGAAGAKAPEDRAKEIIAPLSDPILLLRSGRIVASNPAARQLLGDWIEGHDIRLALRHPATVERLTRPARTDRAVEQLEVLGIGQTDRNWLVTIATLEDETRLIHLSDRSAAVAAEKMRVDFVANASHELRTPLATVLGFIETLEDDSAGSDQEIRKRFLGLMHGEGKRMQQLIEDLMSLSRIEAERFGPLPDPVDLVPLVQEVAAACEELLRQRGNRLVVEDRSSGTVVQGDRGQLLQLIRNLLVNALKYGRAESEVTVTFEDEPPNGIRVTVADRGDGIAPEHLPRLTERFYRVDAGRSRAVGGTGLGLAIVKHIVTRHRGRLDIRSVVGEGTRVVVNLPRAE
jgi:two-component system, OmpR family, phosphate regulon sensor histidine kinase PhoR